MSKLGTMVTKQSAMLQACCSFTSTGARASSTTTNNAQQAATTGDTGPPTTLKAEPFHLLNSSCFAVANRSESSPRLPSNVTYLKKKSNWERYLKDSEKNCQLMVIIFTTTWFRPGYNAEEEMKSLAKDFKDLRFARVDVDHLMDVAKEWNVESIPTFVLLKKDREEQGNTENEKDLKKEVPMINETKDGNKDGEMDKKVGANGAGKEDITSKDDQGSKVRTLGKAAAAAATSARKKGNNKSKEGHTGSLKEIGREKWVTIIDAAYMNYEAGRQ